MSSPSPRGALSGRTLGEFIVREQIGEGGFGAVYRAEQPLLGRDAVIKVLHAREPSGESVQRFLREVRLAARLDHPFAAHIYAYGAEPDGLRWIAMELVRGTPLDKLLEAHGPLPVERLVGLLDRICEVLHAAHDQGIVHRDIKPANVMVLARAGRLSPKLLDFGIAKLREPSDPASTAAPTPPPLDGRAPTETRGGAGDRGPREGPTRSALAETLAAPDPELRAAERAALTRDGVVVGSPLYMAPEQWVSAGNAEVRSDIYSLGCLAFEALTGQPPFPGSSLGAIAAGHARGAVPALGAGFPADLDAVLQRALAKRPEQRFATALEMAAAFRAASGVTEEREALPQLPEELRERALADAPQPIADSLAALDGAHNAHQAREAVWQVAHAAARYLGLIALAGSTRVASRGHDAPEVARLLQRLRSDGLTDEQWLEIARLFTRPFADRREAYPLPELVALLWSREAEPRPSALDKLLAERAAGVRSSRGRVEQIGEQLARMVGILAEMLATIEFLNGYVLAVPDGERAVRWMGARRPRASVRVLGAMLAARQPVLLTGEGAPLLELAPLVKLARPAPGAAEELFFLEGPGLRGAKLVAIPLGFQRHDDGLWEWLGEELLPARDSALDEPGDAGAPYRGLAPFHSGDSTLFFGREREAEAFANRLRVQPLLAVVGASGAGKSSFVNAGVVPLLPADWHVIALRPGPAPVAALSARLLKEGIGFDPRRPESLGDALRACAAGRQQTFLLVIDQLEELVTLCADDGERMLFARALADAARAPEEPVRVVATLRDDFLIRCEQLPGLKERLGAGLQLLHTPAPDELLRILVEPARRARFEFEDPKLPQEMVSEVAGLPSALPLLSFTAAKLWELRDRHFRQLPRAAYRALGGVGGALARHAEETLSAMAGDGQRLARDVFRNLVTSEGTRAVLSRSDLVRVLGGGARAEAVLETLIAARLLVSSEGEQRDERVEVVHEALLGAWPRLQGWLREDAEGTRLRDQLRAAARQWEERGRPRGLLWRDDALAEYQLWRRSHPGALTDGEERFTGASLADASRGRRWRTGLVATAFVLLAAGLTALTALYRRSEAARTTARQLLLESYVEQGRTAIVAGRHWDALLHLTDALRLGADSPSLRLMRGLALAPARALVFRARAHDGRIWNAAYSPDGRWILTAGPDGAALWDGATGRLARRLIGHQGTVRDAVFNGDGSRVATAGWDQTARVWDTSSGRLLHTLRGHDRRLIQVAFSPDGARVATVAEDDTLRIWDPAREAEVARFDAPQANDLVWGPRLVAVAGLDGKARLWDPTSGRLVATLAHGDQVRSVRFDGPGARLVTASKDKSARVWEVPSGRLLQRLTGAGDGLELAAFSPDGTEVVGAARDGVARIWDVASGALRLSLQGHSGAVWYAEFDPAGRRILTAGDDGSARIWDRASGHAMADLEGHSALVWRAHFSADGERVMSASGDGSIAVWRAADPYLVQHLDGIKVWCNSEGAVHGRFWSMACDPLTRVWEVDAGGARLVAELPGAQGVAVAAAGKRAVTRSGQTLTVWSLPQGREERRLSVGADLTALDVGGDARLLAGSTDGVARLFRLDDGSPIATIGGHEGGVSAVAFDRDGRRFATAATSGKVRLFRGDDPRPIGTAEAPRQVNLLLFSPDGRWLGVASDSAPTVLLWDTVAGAPLVLRGAHDQPVELRFSGAGDRIVAASQDGSASIWDLPSGKLLAKLTPEGQYLADAAIDPSGQVALAGDGAGDLRFFETATGQRLGTLRGMGTPAHRIAFLGGQRVVVLGAKADLSLWSIPLADEQLPVLEQETACKSPAPPPGARCTN